jgi:tetratricopeptide (TPR) repeat protein
MIKNNIKKIALLSTEWLIMAWLYRLVIGLMGQRSPTALYVLAATTYRKHGLHTQAMDTLQVPLAQKPPSHLVIEQVAECFMAVGNWRRAAKNWQYVISLRGQHTSPHIWHKLARSFRFDERWLAANFAITRAIKLYPEHLGIWQEGARIATFLKDWALAVERWQFFYENHPSKDLEATVQYAAALRQTGQAERALAVLDEGRKRHGHQILFLIEEAENANDTEDWAKAHKLWKRLAQISPSKGVTLSTERHIRLNQSVTGRLANPTAYGELIKKHKKSAVKRAKSKLRVAIYTSFTAGYDSLKPHEFIDDRFDYFVYSDVPVETLGIYSRKPIPSVASGLGGPRATRYPKTHPHVLFKDYDVAVWLDTSIMLVGDIYPTIQDFLASGKAIGSTPHTIRNALFEEFLACVDLQKDDYTTLKNQFDFYQSEGFDSRRLSENGFLLFNLKHKKLAPALEEWWQQVLTFSKRDQLSFDYSMTKHGVEWYRISEPPHNINNNPNFLITAHSTEHAVLDKLTKQLR